MSSHALPTPRETAEILERIRSTRAAHPERTADLDWLAAHLPANLPPNWALERRSHDGAVYRSRGGLLVILSGAREEDGKRWLHLSVSRRERLPNWEDLKLVKEVFLGAESTALMVFAPKSQWISIHPFVHHLWVAVDGNVTPDFSCGAGSI